MALPAPRGRRKLTEARKRIFLEELAKHGCFAEAARVASPHARAHDGGAATFKDQAARDPDFRAAVDRALEEADGRLEKAAWDRAVNGYARPVFQQGRQVGTELVFSDAVLLKLLSSRIARYQDRQHLTVDGRMDHRSVGITLSSADLLALGDQDRQQLTRILELIADAREEPSYEYGQLPAPDA